MKMYTVKLSGCERFNAASRGGNLRWHKGQERTMAEDDTRLGYYRSQRAFEVFEQKPVVAKHPVAPSARPKKAPTEKVAPAPPADLGAEEAPPLAEPAPELDESPPGPNLPPDSELEKWKKEQLLELGEEYGLEVSSGMTKAEIRAEIDTIR